MTATATTTTRDATTDDLMALADMGVRFVEWSPYNMLGATRDEIAAGIMRVIEAGGGFARLLEEDGRAVGMLLAVIAPTWFAPSVLIASELAWWVEPTHRRGSGSLRLFRDFEAWGRQRGARVFSASDLDQPDSPAGKVFEAMGYRQSPERGWLKGVS